MLVRLRCDQPLQPHPPGDVWLACVF